MMNYRVAAFTTVKQAKAFCREHFNGLDLQVVYHPQEHHCATATWRGRAKGTHIRIIKALPGLFRVQSQMHAQQGQDVLLNQRKVIKASPTIAAQQGSNTQMGATKEGVDITRVENGTWSSDVSLELLDLPFDVTLSTTVILRTLSGASGKQQGTSTQATTDFVLAQPSNIQEAMNLGVRSTGAVDPPASATGPVGEGKLVVPTRGGGSATMVDLDLTIPQESGGKTDIEMTGATAGAGLDQILQGLNWGVNRVPTISLVGNGADGEYQTAAGELAGGKGPPTASTEMEVNTLDRNNSPETSPAQKGPIQSSMVTPRIS
jgi:hypothetical protein